MNATAIHPPPASASTDTGAERLQRAAVYYTEQLRWPVFPLHPIRADGMCGGCGGAGCAGKHPLSSRWDRTIASVRAAEATWRPAIGARGIGLACGASAGVWVLDVDVATDGPDTLQRLERQHGPLPDTWRARTGSGGQHIFFLAHDDRVRNSAGQVAPGLDVRGTGGYVVLAPSPHRSGATYEWIRAPWDGLCGQAPDWLLTLALMRPRRANANGHRALVTGESGGKLVSAGRRHEALVRFCGLLRSMGLGEECLVECGMAFLRHHAEPEPPMDMQQAERDMRDIARRYPPARPKRR